MDVQAACITNTVVLQVETAPFYPAFTNRTFKIALNTNRLSGAWTTNSTPHSITGAVTTVTLTNAAKSAFFGVVD